MRILEWFLFCLIWAHLVDAVNWTVSNVRLYVEYFHAGGTEGQGLRLSVSFDYEEDLFNVTKASVECSAQRRAKDCLHQKCSYHQPPAWSIRGNSNINPSLSSASFFVATKEDFDCYMCRIRSVNDGQLSTKDQFGEWSEPGFLQLPLCSRIKPTPALLVLQYTPSSIQTVYNVHLFDIDRNSGQRAVNDGKDTLPTGCTSYNQSCHLQYDNADIRLLSNAPFCVDTIGQWQYR